VVTSIDTLDDGITPRTELVPVRFNGLKDSFHVRVSWTLSSKMRLRAAVNAGKTAATWLLAESYASTSSAITSQGVVDWGYEIRTGDEVAVLSNHTCQQGRSVAHPPSQYALASLQRSREQHKYSPHGPPQQRPSPSSCADTYPTPPDPPTIQQPFQISVRAHPDSIVAAIPHRCPSRCSVPASSDTGDTNYVRTTVWPGGSPPGYRPDMPRLPGRQERMRLRPSALPPSSCSLGRAGGSKGWVRRQGHH
jgi:hypothetical protein